MPSVCKIRHLDEKQSCGHSGQVSIICFSFVCQDNKKMKKSLEEEQRARKELEKLVRKVLKSMNDPSWDETNL